MIVVLLCLVAIEATVAVADAESDAAESDRRALARYSRELLETMKRQVELAKMATEQLGTMMGPRIGTHFTELAGYCAQGVSVTSHWNLTTTDCLYECLSADECAGYNFYSLRDRPGATRCEMVTVNLFCGLEVNAECTMFIRRWRNSQFGTLFSGSRIASLITRTETMPSMSECVGACKRDNRCMHVSYRQPDQTCRMHATGGGATIEDYSWLAYGRVVYCPDFYIRFQNSCFRPIKAANETWNRAQALCRAESGTMTPEGPKSMHLVNIHSAEENQFIMSVIAREAPNLNWWIGAFESNGDWRWTDTAETDSSLTFQYWSDNVDAPESAKCAYFDVALQKWNRATCDGSNEIDKFYYICETQASRLDHPFAN